MRGHCKQGDHQPHHLGSICVGAYIHLMIQRPPGEAGVKNRRPLAALMLANAISVTGNRMALLAIPWFVLTTTGSAAKTGIAGFFTFLPIVVAGLLGPIVDRLGLRRASILADVASGVSVALIPLLFHTVGLEFWQLLVLVFVGGLLDTPGNIARLSLLPEVASAGGTTLERATSLEDGIMRAAAMVGAPAAGVLIGVIGASNVLWVNAASFGVSALIVAFGVPRVAREARRDATYWNEFRDGFAFIRSERLVLLVILTITVTNFLDGAISSVILPVYAKRVLGDAFSLGLILGTMGGGALLGAFAYGAWGRGFSRRWVYVIGFLLAALQPLGYSVFPPFALVIAIALVAGVGAGPINPIVGAVLLERVPGAMRGRVLGVVMAIAWMAWPLGVLAGGYFVQTFGLRNSFVVTGGLYLAATLSLAVNPGVKDLERPADAHEAPERERPPIGVIP